MKKFLLLCPILMSAMTFAQIHYEPGTFTDNAGNKKDVLIKYEDLKDNPTSFQYKTEESAQPQQAELANVSSFEVFNKVKFVRATVDVDQSREDLNNLSTLKTPEFKSEQLFLKILVDGQYELYQYVSGNQSHYFYSDSSQNIKPLVYKAYQIDAGKIGYNESYKSELKENLKCDGMQQTNYSTLNYNKGNLTDVFQKVNKCVDPSYKIAVDKKGKGKFNLYIKPRINFSSLSFQGPFATKESTMDNKASFGFGAELEYVASFNRNKWAIFLDPNFFTYKAESTLDTPYLVGGKTITTIDYKGLDVPIGVRHYLFINNTSKIFIDAMLIPNFTFNSSFEQRRLNGDILEKDEVSSSLNYGFGIGYNYNSKFSIEGRYQSPRPILQGPSSSSFKTVSIAIGYNLF